jgi:peptidoglycan/LPS O-acetylase OafA/YrhL
MATRYHMYVNNFLDPAILFFVFGAFAGLIKSNLEIPQPIARFLSLYLLMALGLKGGFALQKSGFTQEIGLALGLAIFLAIIIPIIAYAVTANPVKQLRLRRYRRNVWLCKCSYFYYSNPISEQSRYSIRRTHGGSDGAHGITRYYFGHCIGQ